MPPPRSVSIGLVQMSCALSREENFACAAAGIAEASKRGAQIICLPELFLSPYFCQKIDDQHAFAQAENIPGPTTNALAALAKKHGIVLIAGSLFERATDGKHYNTSCVFGPDGKLLGLYRKTHIPEDPCYHEKHYFTPGDTGVQIFETPFGNIAPLICYDQWFPEVARIAALRGAEIIFYPTAIGNFVNEKPEEGGWQEAWEAVQRGHAITNSVFVAAVNRVGIEGRLHFFGNSFVSDPFGNVLTHAGSREEVLVTECNLRKIEELREGWGFMRNRRPEMYQSLTNTHQ